ncbi:tetratricopeptide repeat protein [Desulfobacula sp.]|uniref:tetratricopeptide repeat protein n=1 Tax=Desulfobacula sp. TaxID=2593537 RepID=UPI0019B85452|nr:tetratricopeptide repeat protein [Candidatus Neomarinimicrobiota bacterium]MBL6996439.1 tetratricopeptide repeat protein [Desulfobacula sp.]
MKNDGLVDNICHAKLVDMAGVYQTLAGNFAELGLVNNASAINQESIEIYKALNDQINIAENFFELGLIHVQKGNTTEALKYYYSAYRLAERAQFTFEKQTRYLSAIVRVYREKGQVKLAESLHRYILQMKSPN